MTPPAGHELTTVNVMGRRERYRAAVVLSWLCLVSVTWKLWIPQSMFPRVPLWVWWSDVFAPLEFVVGGLALAAAALLVVTGVLPGRNQAAFSRTIQWLSLVATVSWLAAVMGLWGFDQHRLQPWCWHLWCVMVLSLFARDDQQFLQGWRWLVISIYAWSAVSKLDINFAGPPGLFFWEGLFQAIGRPLATRGWSATTVSIMALSIPLGELLVAVALMASQTRRWGALLAVAMHAVLILALGPWGQRQELGVLLWNGVFLIQALVLFWPVTSTAESSPQREDARSIESTSTGMFSTWARRPLLFWCALLGMVGWPATASFGGCDEWLAWSLYAARPAWVRVLIHEDDVAALPDCWQPFVAANRLTDGEYRVFRVDRWSLATVQAPHYPQDRVQLGVATAVWRCHPARWRVEWYGSAGVFSRSRATEVYATLPELESRLTKFRVNAQPSRFIAPPSRTAGNVATPEL